MSFRGIKEKVLRFKAIFSDHWLLFVAIHSRFDTDYYRGEIDKMLTCGTELGGFAIFQCLRCGKGEHKVHFSCKGKACPQCGKRYARDSMIKIAAKLYPGVSYRQVVLTLPSQLRVLFHQHNDQNKLYAGFMKLAQDCLQELIQNRFQRKDYKIAVIVFLHTNGRDGTYNPHLHVILGEGALDPQTKQWKTFKTLYLKQLRLLWQKHLLCWVAEEFQSLKALVDTLWRDYPDGFYAHLGNNDKVPTKSYQGLIKYLTKYLSSPPIGVSRIVSHEGNQVKYYYQSHRTKSRVFETIDAQLFIGRMVQHILPKGFQRVRYYGLQATETFKKWYEIIASVAGDLVDAMASYVKRIGYSEFFQEVAKHNPLKCKHCGSGMDLVRLYPPNRGVFYDLLASPDS